MPEIAGIGVAWAFLAGVVSFLSPCVLPLVPGYVSYVAGRSLDELVVPGLSRTRLAALALSVGFVLGFSLVFVLLGASASALGRLFLSYRGEADLVAGAIVVLFGLHMAGVLRWRLLQREWRLLPSTGHGGIAGAVLLGGAFAFGWTPCIGPVLGSILTLGANGTTVTEGMLLLAIYSLGLAVPFLLVAAFTGGFLRRMKSLARIGRPLQTATGLLLVLVGVAMATGELRSFGTWILETFPVLQVLVI